MLKNWETGTSGVKRMSGREDIFLDNYYLKFPVETGLRQGLLGREPQPMALLSGREQLRGGTALLCAPALDPWDYEGRAWGLPSTSLRLLFSQALRMALSRMP